MLDSMRESVLRLAQEEEARRAGQSRSGGSASAGKKKKKKKFQQMAVNAERVVLFDFQAAPEYPEQVSVKANEVVFVFESFEDGWSQVKNYSGSMGVVPSAYLGNIIQIDKESPNNKSFFSPQFKQRTKVLALMAVDQFKVKSMSLAETMLRGAKYAVTDLIIPSAVKMFLIVSRNESYTTIVSGFVRKAFEAVVGSLVPSLADDELAYFSAQLRDESGRIKAEKTRRSGRASLRGAAPSTAPTDGAKTD